MKIAYSIVLSVVLLGTSAMALSVKVKDPLVVKGTTVGKYAKPGAPVDIRYTSEHVDVGDVSNVDIVFTSSATQGTMKVNIKVDKNLNEHTGINKHLTFDLDTARKDHPVHLEVSADDDGLYYVRVMVSIKGKGMRAFAVPVYVGNGKVTKQNVTIEKTKRGENISVSKAKETVSH